MGRRFLRPIASESRVLTKPERNYGMLPKTVKDRNKAIREEEARLKLEQGLNRTRKMVKHEKTIKKRENRKEKKIEKPVGYACEPLSEEESRKGAYEREGLAVMFALRTFGMYLRSRPFILRTDQKALTYLFNQSKPSDRVQGWLNTMSEFNFEFDLEYIKGKENVVADALSRRPDLAIRTIRACRLRIESEDDTRTEIKREQIRAPEFIEIFRALRKILGPMDRYTVKELDIRDKYVIQNELLYRKEVGAYECCKLLLCIPRTMRKTILEECHNTLISGHLGGDKTYHRAKQSVYWIGMKIDILDYVNRCVYCKGGKPESGKTRGLLQPLPIPEGPWRSISMDFIVGLPEVGEYSGIMTVVDRFTKSARFVPMTTREDGGDVAELLFIHVISEKGFPSDIVSDRDPRFTGEVWQGLMKRAQTKLRMSTAHHPQTDGQTERMNRTLEEMLRVTLLENHNMDWVKLLPSIKLAYNSAKQSSTGMSPMEAEMGIKPNMPLQLVVGNENGNKELPLNSLVGLELDDHLYRQNKIQLAVQRNLLKAQSIQKEYADRKRVFEQFKVGDKVMVSSRNIRAVGKGVTKLQEKFYGPCVVERVVSPLAYQIQLPQALRYRHPVFPLSLLRRVDPTDKPPRVPGTEPAPGISFSPAEPKRRGRRSTGSNAKNLGNDEEDDTIYEIDRIVGREWRDGTLKYEVVWSGYDEKDTTWEPARSFVGETAKEILENYERTYLDEKARKAAERAQAQQSRKRDRATAGLDNGKPRYELRGGAKMCLSECTPMFHLHRNQ
eukprot:Rmarinus@m.14175